MHGHKDNFRLEVAMKDLLMTLQRGLLSLIIFLVFVFKKNEIKMMKTRLYYGLHTKVLILIINASLRFADELTGIKNNCFEIKRKKPNRFRIIIANN